MSLFERVGEARVPDGKSMTENADQEEECSPESVLLYL